MSNNQPTQPKTEFAFNLLDGEKLGRLTYLIGEKVFELATIPIDPDAPTGTLAEQQLVLDLSKPFARELALHLARIGLMRSETGPRKAHDVLNHTTNLVNELYFYDLETFKRFLKALGIPSITTATRTVAHHYVMIEDQLHKVEAEQ